MPWEQLLQSILALIFVLALMAALKFWLGRNINITQGKGEGPVVKKITNIDGKNRAVCLKYKSKEYLIITNGNNPPTVIDSYSNDEENA